MELLIPIFGIIGVFGMPAVIVWVALHFNNRKKEQYHETLRKLIDSGQELSPELLKSIPGYAEEETKVNDIKTGAILSGIGIGVALIGYVGLGSKVVLSGGLLVLALGLAFLIYGIYDKTQNPDPKDV
jgi:membrane-bound ClpP family serine protease